MLQPVEPITVVSLASLAVLCVLVVRKLIVMDGRLEIRVVILTALLWVVVFFLFLLAFPPSPGCVPLSDEGNRFTISGCC